MRLFVSAPQMKNKQLTYDLFCLSAHFLYLSTMNNNHTLSPAERLSAEVCTRPHVLETGRAAHHKLCLMQFRANDHTDLLVLSKLEQN